jgi:hypothetical protein
MAKRRIITVPPGGGLAAALATGKPLRLLAGRYTSSTSTLKLPDGARLYGAGIGQTIIEAALSVGSGAVVHGLTAGRSASGGSHSFRPGSHETAFRNVRFRAPGNERVWHACDYTYWSSPVLKSKGDFHDVLWAGCEFEFSREGCCLFEMWNDQREGGGELHDLTWQSCTFGVRNAAGQFGPQRVGLLAQPSPPEHGTGGPRPGSTTNHEFDWSPITHGMGIPGEVTLHLIECDFVGQTSLASFDLCDNARSWLLTTTRNPDGTPKYPDGVSTNGTAEERAAVPDRFWAHGWEVRDCRFADSFIQEIGKGTVVVNSPKHMGDDPVTYFARDSVLAHDRELYGLGAPA